MSKAWSGKSKFLYSYGKETAEELARWGKQKLAGESARDSESKSKNLWSMIGTGIAFIAGLGPIAPAVGTVVGNIAKSFSVDESKSVMDTDPGVWNKAQDRVYLENLNREFEAYDTGEFWAGMEDIGKSAYFAYQFGGGADKFGLPTKESLANWSPTQWGGKGGQTTKELIGSLFSDTTTAATSEGIGVSSDIALGPDMKYKGPGMGTKMPADPLPSFQLSPIASMEIDQITPFDELSITEKLQELYTSRDYQMTLGESSYWDEWLERQFKARRAELAQF